MLFLLDANEINPMLPSWLPLDLTQEINFAHHGDTSLSPQTSLLQRSRNTHRHDLGHDSEPQPEAPLLTCMLSNNTCALIFKETSCYALSISCFLRTEIQMEAVTAKGIYISPCQLGIETIDNGNETLMQQEELYLCQNRTAYSILQFGIKTSFAIDATVAASALS
jgi:hypothetical protein